MLGYRAKRPAPSLPNEKRYALVIATTTYDDPSLRELRAPSTDATAFSKILADDQIAGFSVTPVIDKTCQEIRVAIEEFLSDRAIDDVLLIYVTCHGLLDDRRRLYFAATDTQKKKLKATAVDSRSLADQLEECRARRQITILDCCFSGAFARGAKGDDDLDLGRLHGGGRGKVLLTASRGTEYSFEGEPVLGSSETGSIFTSALIDGITTGDADFDHDGLIYVDDLYHYAFEKMQAINARQTPQLELNDVEGRILLARNPIGLEVTPAPIPDGIIEALNSNFVDIRRGAVNAIGQWLFDNDVARQVAATNALHGVIENDVPAVAAAAQELLDGRDSSKTVRIHRDCDAASTVVGIRVPTVQVTDSTAGVVEIELDNSGTTRDAHVHLEVRSDDADLVTALASPDTEVRAGEIGTIALRLEAPLPESGEEATRHFVVAAKCGTVRAEAPSKFVQVATLQPPPTLRIEPRRLTSKDKERGHFRVIVNNSNGTRPLRVRVTPGSADPMVRCAFAPAFLSIAPHGIGESTLTVTAPVPPSGEQIVRPIDVRVLGSQHELSAHAELVQRSSESTSTIDSVRIEPERIEVTDAERGRARIIVHNNASSGQPALFRLFGQDESGSVSFDFDGSLVAVPAGHSVAVDMTVTAPLPSPGSRLIERPIRVQAKVGGKAVSATGVFAQSVSAPPIAKGHLDLWPNHVQVRNKQSGRFDVRLRNDAIAAIHVQFGGTSSDQDVEFAFAPAELDIAPGEVGQTRLVVTADTPPAGREVVRTIRVRATEGDASVEASGVFTQATTRVRRAHVWAVVLCIAFLLTLILAWMLGG